MKGNVFNIQKFSIHDGPGIRTTVFFKGCPLRCKWCSNPESQESKIQITYDIRKCIGCQSCISSCPKGSLSYTNGRINIDYKNCIGCQTCVSACVNKALTSEGKMTCVEEIVETCLQDIDFYEESNGGVTLTGGECMCQPEFVKELIGQLKEHHIHIACETTGYIDKEIFHELAPQFDLILFDVKHYDSDRHFEGTGVYNELILENLAWAHEQGLNILPRIPVIPTFNASLSDASGIARAIRNIGLKNVQLLPFHQFGERKYELLNRNYELKDIKALYKEDLSDYQKVFLDLELNCYF